MLAVRAHVHSTPNHLIVAVASAVGTTVRHARLKLCAMIQKRVITLKRRVAPSTVVLLQRNNMSCSLDTPVIFKKMPRTRDERLLAALLAVVVTLNKR